MFSNDYENIKVFKIDSYILPLKIATIAERIQQERLTIGCVHFWAQVRTNESIGRQSRNQVVNASVCILAHFRRCVLGKGQTVAEFLVMLG